MSAVRVATEGRWTVEGYCGDTAVLGKDLWPDLSRGKKGDEKGIPLRWIGHTYTDTAPWKLPKKSKGRPTYRTPEELYVYNAGDCKTTLDGYYNLWEEAEAEDIGIDLVQNDLAHQLLAVDMQRVGLPVDYSRLVGVETEVKGKLAAASADFTRIVGREINLNSPAQMREVLYGDWKLPITVETQQGPSTADPVLRGLRGLSTLTPEAAAGLDALFRIREHGQVLKLYLKPILRLYRNGRIHPTWGATNTVTGRYTSSPNCFSGDTEILTEHGWVRFDGDLSGARVAQWANGVVSFTHPTSFVKKRAERMVRINNQHIDLRVTPDHRCLLRHRKTGEHRVFAASDYVEDWQQLHGGVFEGGLSGRKAEDPSPELITLLCAIQADGSYEGRCVKFNFHKLRKVARLTTALTMLGAPFETKPVDDHGYSRVYIIVRPCPALDWIKERLGPTKLFDSWLLGWSREALDFFGEEVFRWDGCITRMNHYASKHQSNADWVQVILTLSGKRANTRQYVPKNPNAVVSHQVDVTHRDYSMTTNVEKAEQDDPQDVYCVSVPSSYIIVRRNGKVAVTGNCQNLGDIIKQIVCAPPGWALVASDFAAVEQRGMGALVGGDLFDFVNKPDATTDEEKFDPDFDCHSHVARLVYGDRFVHPEQFLLEISDTGERMKQAAKKKKGMRNDTKRVVYARNYGSGVDTIFAIVREANQQADKGEVGRVIQVYDRRFPELPQYRERMYRQVNDPTCRELRSPLLRRRRKFPGRNPVPLTDASNYALQSLAADIMNLGMLALARRLPRDAAIIAQVHDSILVLCRDYDANSVRDLMDEVLPCRHDLGHGAMLFDAKAKIGHSWDEV